jgi:hypothetical protein
MEIYILIAIKVLRIMFYRNLVFTNGHITSQDLILDIFMSCILFYTLSLLIDKEIKKEDFVYFIIDTIAFFIFMSMYLLYINNKNKKSYIEAFQQNESAKEELKIQKDKGSIKSNIGLKPIAPFETFVDINIITILCILPYFVVALEI